MKLRPYQSDAVASVINDWRDGLTDVLGVAATGAGKTQIFLALLQSVMQSGQRALIIAHRAELIHQPIERTRSWPEWNIGMGVVMAGEDNADAPIVVATIQTLSSTKRLADVIRYGRIDYLIIDEAHHVNAQSYRTLIDRLRDVNPDLRHLGVTATPRRADGDGLSRVYQRVAFKVSIADLVREHYLVQPRWLGIATGIDLRGVASRSGDYIASQLTQRFDTPAGREIILQSYERYAAGRRAIAFTASVQGAHDLAQAFSDAGITAAAIDGTTPREERAAILERYRDGSIQILANCQVLTEGFDAPGTSCILMCRPTKSDALYIQCMGRGLRPALGIAQPGEDCLILDFMPADTRDIRMAGDVLGVPRNAIKRAIDEANAEPGEAQAGFSFDGIAYDATGTPLEIIARELDYFNASPYVWHRHDAATTLGLGVSPKPNSSDEIDRILAITRDGETATLWGIWRTRPMGTREWSAPQCRQLATGSIEEMGEQGNVYAAKHGQSILTSKGRSWHTDPATSGQIAYLKRLAPKGERNQIGDDLTKQGAAALITHYQAIGVLRDLQIVA